MIAYLLLAILVLVTGFALAMRRYADVKTFSLILMIAIAVAVAILAFPHFYRELQDVVLALLASMRYGPTTLSMKVESDILDFLPSDWSWTPVYKILLYSLYLLGPLCASVAVISYTRLLGEWLLTLRYATVHVFSSLEERTISIAESIGGKRKLIVFCNGDKVRDESLKYRAHAIRAMILNKKETEIHLRKNRHYEFYLLGKNNEQCLIRATALCDDLLSEKNFEQKNIVVRIFIDRDAIEYIRKLDEKYGNQLYLRYVDADNSTAIEALRKMKPWLVNRRHHNIAVVNAGKSSQLMISHLLCLLNEPESSCEIHVIDRRARELISSLKMNAPEVLNLEPDSYLTGRNRKQRNYDISFHETADDCYSVIEALEKAGRPDIIIFGADDDQKNLELAGKVKRYYACGDDSLSYPRMAVQVSGRQLNKVLASEKDVIYFGNIADRYNYDNIIHPELERAAKRVHLVYCGQDVSSLSEQQQEEELIKTGYYNYVNIDSSMANALAKEFIYEYIIAQKTDESIDDRKWVEEWLADPENLKKIGDCEHNRWNAYQRLQGWRRASVNQEKKLAASSQGTVKSNEFLLHPALVSVEELPETERITDDILAHYDKKPSRYVQLDRDFFSHLLEILEK